MRDRTPIPSRPDLVLAALAGVAAVVGSYALAGWSRQSFVVAPIDAAVVNATPDVVVRYAIQYLGSAGHVLHIGLAIAIAVAGLAVPSLLALALSRRLAQPLLAPVATGTIVAALLAGTTGALGPAVAAGLSAGIVLAAGTLGLSGTAAGDSTHPDARADPARRRLVGVFLGTAAYAGLGSAIGGSAPKTGEATEELATKSDTDELLNDAAAQSFDVAGLGGLVTPIGEFYETDINSFDPSPDPDKWTLTVTGEVDQEVTLDYDELTGREPEHRFVTLRCVGESLNGHKMDNALWTGIPIAALIEEAGVSSDCGCVMARAADGYFVQFPYAALKEGFLAYGMNGMGLPKQHGRPVRLLVPGHWGEVNVKWITELEFLDEAVDGYWEKRGWHGTGPVETVAKLHATNELADGAVEVAGHAYAGTRGVDRVEVSTDGGDTWTDAELSEPLPGEDVWRMWRHRFTPGGETEVVVRAVDGTGAVQPEEYSQSYPSGATGWVRKTVSG
ncbi:molybdopterin-dependent oxidoreductase [Haloarchaeobius amylolyticus]|uniref:molybdopterin-dependent oxidoreductase n=1 Tax=Haloarchaeobius amylolyticus TaxID=1198296 RepID=UPI00226FC561|nr:molybdopterin-dependent oxidoreductase [Haloarchaeobius amylolyticus]